MIVSVDDKKYALVWNYVKQTDGRVASNCKVIPIVSTEIVDGREFNRRSDVAIGIGEALQSKSETHCKSTARKITLARAIGSDPKYRESSAGFNPTQREKIWEQYLN